MTQEAADLLIGKIEAERRWPPPFDRERIGEVAQRAAFREADEPTLRSLHKWPQGRDYIVDPIGDRIATAKADLVFGEDPVFRASKESDQANVMRIVERGDLPSELHYADQLRASEGEVWWRLESNDMAGCVIPTFHSREVVVPLFMGPILIAVAFVSEFEEPTRGRNARPRVWRHLEIQSAGRVENRLYYGYNDTLGQGRPLTDFSETNELDAVWNHGLPGILAGRVVFRRGRDRALGRSVFQGVPQIMLALNEAMTIGVENARLVAKKRAVIPAQKATTRDPALPVDSIDNGDGTRRPVESIFDAGEDVLLAGGLDEELGKEPGAGLFKVLEYSFDAEALIAWQDKLVSVLASRCGLTVQFLGEGAKAGEGTAETGTALRVKLLPATTSSRGSARAWDDALPHILMLAQLLDAEPMSRGGFQRPYTAAGVPPSIQRRDPLPRDRAEDFAAHSTATGGPVESIETAVRDLNPDWGDAEIKAEVDRIRADVQTANSFVGLGAPPSDDLDEDLPPTPES